MKKEISFLFVFLVLGLLFVIAPNLLLAANPDIGGGNAFGNATAAAEVPQFTFITGLDNVNTTYSHADYDYTNDLMVFKGSDAFKVVTNAANGGIIAVSTGGTLANGFSAFTASLTVTAMTRGITNTVVNVSIKANPALVAPGNGINTGGTITITATPSW